MRLSKFPKISRYCLHLIGWKTSTGVSTGVLPSEDNLKVWVIFDFGLVSSFSSSCPPTWFFLLFPPIGSPVGSLFRLSGIHQDAFSSGLLQ